MIWILYARVYAQWFEPDGVAIDVDTALRQAPVALDWLEHHIIEAAGK
ncbi:MAG TPA: hypothetical protein VN903_34715 [Polyangia bacterium]|nr:hypothetical protein [Polyangia bacterium]